MTDPIIIRPKDVYGRTLYYVTSMHQAALENLTGKATLSYSDMKSLESLGLNIRVAIPGALIPWRELDPTAC